MSSAPPPQSADRHRRLQGKPSRTVITWAPWLRVVNGVLAGLVLVAIAITLTAVLFVRARGPEAGESPDPVTWVLLVLVGIPFVGAMIILIIRGMRLALVLEPDGITVRGMLRTHRIPWERVARIEQADGSPWRRAVRVGTVEGRRITAVITAHQYLMLRGEPWQTSPTLPGQVEGPVAAAIAAHQEWLRTHSA